MSLGGGGGVWLLSEGGFVCFWAGIAMWARGRIEQVNNQALTSSEEAR